MSDRGKTAIKLAGEKLRALALASEEGTLLGSEEALIAELGVSRSTVRQVARLLEREGLLKVRRGPSGGYFAARPDAETIQSAVSAYLETLEMDREDVTAIASALWVEVVRKAAANRSDEARAIIDGFRQRVASLKPNASFTQIRKLDLESRKAIFDLTNSRYIELIFDINMAFASRTFPLPAEDETPEHVQFVRTWRDAKVMELTAITEQDAELAAIAARYVRKVWHDRIWARRRKDASL
jgi:DNA-binding FadR family transcriptional regulator